MSKRMERLILWIENNPYVICADYQDTITDKQAQMLLSGNFQQFDEDMFENELRFYDYIDWSSWEEEFSQEAGYMSFDVMPENIQNLAYENRNIDTSHYIRGCINNYSGNIVAYPMKKSGDYIEFPHAYNDKESNNNLARYFRRDLGFKKEIYTNYPNTILVILGQIDLLKIYESQRAPKFIIVDKYDSSIGHAGYEGAGEGYYDSYYGLNIPRKFAAKFFVDGQQGFYSIDSIFGLSGSFWKNFLNYA
jgi:hypothetical protein